jgi:hypothetical protein
LVAGDRLARAKARTSSAKALCSGLSARSI